MAMTSNYRINEFAKRVGRSVQTVRRWQKEGKLTAKRLPCVHLQSHGLCTR